MQVLTRPNMKRKQSSSDKNEAPAPNQQANKKIKESNDDPLEILRDLVSKLPPEMQSQVAHVEGIVIELALNLAEELVAGRVAEALQRRNEKKRPVKDEKGKRQAQLGFDKATEEERREREKKKEEEKLGKEKKRLEEKLEREKKREEERLERERKKEEERLEREKKKEEERLEREKKKEEDRLERERNKEEERKKREDQKRKEQEAKDRQQSRLANFFTVQKPKTSTPESEFDRVFLPYYQRSNVTIHLPLDARPKIDVETVCKRMDEDFQGGEDIFEWFKAQRRLRGDNSVPFTAREVVDLANSETATEAEIAAALATLPYKHLQFAENIRPPYQGTFQRRNVHIPRGTFLFKDSGMNYDYDSDIEWTHEDEEGEDLDEESSADDEDDDDGDDMEDFLSSDEGDAPRRRIVGPLTAFVSWNDGKTDTALYKSLEIDVLSYNGVPGPIDPYRDYWSTPDVKPEVRPTKLIAPQDMSAFVDHVQGSTETKMFLTEMLKRALPRYSKEILRATLTELAKRVGRTWEVRRDMLEQYGKPGQPGQSRQSGQPLIK
ncbi:uncharacterized protein SAPINGB_P002560 [Magnusiomyces paraingens]|uniref:Chromatin assembly factor 1 subunit p90 n=1 Tax=Magnusiomyces paraingens TaxID=2606893 RepID=A0A5E8BET4_9ASCO|nr:uncharacterized protein SAPINGB_P002560 [Saprochaete ingens]VVT50019.1 unnamed protein product [Saprochaete ingens]